MNSVGKCTYMQNEENKNQKHKKYNEQTQTVYFQFIMTVLFLQHNDHSIPRQ